MKTSKYDCPTCKNKKTIQINYELAGNGVHVEIKDCTSCKTRHTFNENNDLIRYEDLSKYF